MRRRAQRSSVLIPVETASKSARSALSGCGTSLFTADLRRRIREERHETDVVDRFD
jgi:hypothetical protein